MTQRDPSQRPIIGVLVTIVHRHQPLWVGAAEAALAHNVDMICLVGGALPALDVTQANRTALPDKPDPCLYDLVKPDMLDGVVTWAGPYIGVGMNRDEAAVTSFMTRYQGLPLVNYEGILPGRPTIWTNTYEGMRELLAHLVETHKCRRIALIRGPEGHQESDARYRAYIDTLTHYGLQVDPALICPPGKWGTTHGSRMAHLLLTTRRLRPGIDFDAIATSEIDYAIGCMRILQERGVRVPEDIAVVSFNDHTEAMLADPPITVMRKPFYTSGVKAIEAVLDLIKAEPVPDCVEVPTSLRIRRSCGCMLSPSSLDDNTEHLDDKDWQRTIHRDGILLDLGEEMLSASTIDDLADHVSRRLPEMGIPGCYLALYDETELYTTAGHAPTWSQVVLALNDGQRVDYSASAHRVRTERLVHEALMPGEQAAVWIAMPLHFSLRQSGFALFKVGPRDGQFYQALAREISSALQSVLTLQKYRRAQQSLRESEARLHTLIENMPVQFWAKDLNGTYFMQNTVMRKLSGDSVGLTLDDLDIDETTRARRREEDERVRNGETITSEHRVIKEGQDRTYREIVAPVKVDGKVIATQGLRFDVTEQKHLEDSLRQAQAKAEDARRVAEDANQAKSRFLAHMSHELRTPLNAVLGFSELVSRGENLTNVQREDLAIIRRSGTHLLGLINDILDLSKIEAGKIELQPQAFDLHELLLGLGEMFSLRAEEKGLSLVFDLGSDVGGYIRADEGRLRQVLINLLGNAVKFTQNGSIRVNISKEEAQSHTETPGHAGAHPPVAQTIWLRFEVHDTGVGIAPEEIPLVFEAFEQTESGRQISEGTGLGLPLSRDYIRLMGGEMWVTSQVNVGSCFSFNLPVESIAKLTPKPDGMLTQQPIALAPGEPAYRLLIVDDAEDNRQLLIRLLAPLGFEVREAADGATATMLWQTWRPDLIFLDLQLPDISGATVAEIIRANPGGAEVAIIVLTASTVEQERLHAAGCDVIIHKPFKTGAIFNALTQYLGVRFTMAPQGVSPYAAQTAAATAGPLPSAAPPQAWITAMRTATIEGDVQQIARLIERIRDSHAALAEHLDQLAAGYAHDDILATLKEVCRNAQN